MTELTPNEKAATFLGWKPERICSGLYYGGRRGHQFKIIPCEHGQTNAHVVDAAAAPSPLIHWKDGLVPDMTSPANYMRALESIVAVNEEYRDRSRSIKLRHQPWVRGANWAVEIELIERTVGGRWAASPGEAAMLLLAQLFDEEHRNG